MRDMHDANAARRWFIGLWLALLLVKLLLAARLPLFVDEAFYWQEGQHLAWAYSDLPGLTAWLARVGDSLAPGHVLALRLPFLLMVCPRLGCTPGWALCRCHFGVSAFAGS